MFIRLTNTVWIGLHRVFNASLCFDAKVRIPGIIFFMMDLKNFQQF